MHIICGQRIHGKAPLNWFCQYLSFLNSSFNRFLKSIKRLEKCGVTPHCSYRNSLTLIEYIEHMSYQLVIYFLFLNKIFGYKSNLKYEFKTPAIFGSTFITCRIQEHPKIFECQRLVLQAVLAFWRIFRFSFTVRLLQNYVINWIF